MKIAIFIVLFIFTNQSIFTEENIVTFDNKFALSLSNKYNFIEYFHGMDNGFYSYDIIDVGLGISYKNTFFNFNFTVPLVYIIDKDMALTFDLGIKHCGNKYFFEGNLEYYNNFYHKGKSINMEIFSVGLFIEYVFNNKNHSLGSVYALNGYQLRSSGSFLLGLDMLFSNMRSNDNDNKIEKNNLIIFGPNIGYSYTFIFEYNLFLNMMLIIAPDTGINYNDGSFCFSPQMRPKITLGHHGRLWSINAVLESNFSYYIKHNNFINMLETADVGFTISKRF
jgi:hypothetical protein